MEAVTSIIAEPISMSTISTGETSPPTTENLMTPASVDYNYIEQQKEQSSIISVNMVPPTSAATSCGNTIMSNSSSQIDLFAETPSMDTSGTICSSSDLYVNVGVLDLSGTGLEKLNRAAPDYVLNTTTLLLDNNCLQRLDNIHTYQCLEKVILIFNKI